MNSWSSNCNADLMANNLMRWWRTKVLNYKPFTVDCNEGRISDTEELLGRNPEYQTSCTTPPLQNQPTHSPSPLPNVEQQNTQQQTQHHLNVEEFSCDVSLEGGPDKSTQERQEFSFTLYDFDGHGKITKDDITGLVTTIYEVLGSSVKVPHYGSKTIKVKLTVSPDQRKHVSATVIGHKNKFDEQTNKTSPNVSSGTTVKQSHNEKKKHSRSYRKTTQERKHYCCRKLDEEHEVAADVSEDYSDVCSRVSADLTSEDEGESFNNQRSKVVRQKRYHKHSSSRYTTPSRFIKEPNVINQKDNFLKLKKVKKRSSSLQRQELLEIIQSNMDKNNSSFQTSRKPCADHISIESSQLQPNDQKQRPRHKTSGAQLPSVPLQYFTNVVDPTHFYVDLASLQNTTQFSQNNCQYDKLVDAVMCVSNKKLSDSKISSVRKHARSKSYDLSNVPLNYPILEPSINVEYGNKTVRKQTRKLADFEPTAAVKRNIRKFPQVVVGHTSSPHHLRHRNRQEDQARAMAQVVRWLEREFSSNLNTKDTREKTQSNSWTGNQETYSCKMPASPNSSSVERHEHHHVHEHIHHHYHHYHPEAPFVV